jgi:hypothetical protein
MFKQILGALISPVTGLIGKVHDNKTRIKEKQIQQVKDAQDDVAAWEAIQAAKTTDKWTNHWFSILLSIPLVGAFIPPAVPHIQAGFAVLDSMPEYYQYWVAVAILSSFGIKALKN